ncbi:MAG: YceI family protein [Alphaproteobacteria bacterium]|nr:YceI family protein [Alphaproteobacteria bacterium]
MSRFALLFPVAVLSTSAFAGGQRWNVDPAHTRVGFEVSHMMISSVEGAFSDVTGEAAFEPGNPKSLEVTVTVDMASVDTGNADRDAHLAKSDFFDIANHPTMTFKSTKMKAGKDGAFTLTGDLTLRGVTKTVDLQGRGLDQVVTDPWGNQRVGARATGTLNRQDFGVSFNQALETGGLLVGDEVTLSIAVELVAAK